MVELKPGKLYSIDNTFGLNLYLAPKCLKQNFGIFLGEIEPFRSVNSFSSICKFLILDEVFWIRQIDLEEFSE